MKTNKNRISLIIVLLAIGGAAFVAGRWTTPERASETASEAPAEEQEEDHEHADDDADADADDDADEVWTCSMHPQVRQPETGDCPICGMELIPASKADAGGPDDDSDLPRLRLSERSAALINVQTSAVERRVPEARLRFPGRLEADETLLRDVVVRAESYVEDLHADYEWKMVEKGEVLAELYSPEVRAAARELLVGEGVATALGEKEGSPMFGKLRRLGVPKDQIQEIIDTGEAPRTYEIRSPIDGHIMHLKGREGDWLPEGRRLVQVMDPSNLWVHLEAYERDLSLLKPGQQVTFSIEAFPGETFEGEISFINPHVDTRTRTVEARVEMPNPDGRLKPGMFATGAVRAPVEEEDPPLLIPKSAALLTGERAIVYVQLADREQPTFEGREVRLGSRVGDEYIVREGLEAGERVVTRGNFKIDSELQIRGERSMMAPEGGASPAHDHGGGAGGEPSMDEHADHENEGPGESEDESPADAVDETQLPEPADFAEDVPTDFGEELRPFFQGYFEMVAGMADDDFDAARSGLEAMDKALEKIGQHRMEGDAHVAWMQHYEAMDDRIERMKKADDLAGMRDHLQKLSLEMEKIAVSFGAGQLPDMYRTYCPMARDDEGGIWLQDHESVANAYMGEAMPQCGGIIGKLQGVD